MVLSQSYLLALALADGCQQPLLHFLHRCMFAIRKALGHLWPLEEVKVQRQLGMPLAWLLLSIFQISVKSQLNFLVMSFPNTPPGITNNFLPPICVRKEPGGHWSVLTSQHWAQGLVYSRSSIYFCWRYELSGYDKYLIFTFINISFYSFLVTQLYEIYGQKRSLYYGDVNYYYYCFRLTACLRSFLVTK